MMPQFSMSRLLPSRLSPLLRFRSCLRLWLSVWGLLLVLPFGHISSEIFGQESGTPAVPVPSNGLTTELVDRRISQTEDLQDIDEALKKRILDLYGQARDELKQAADAASRAERHQLMSEPEEVQKRLQQVRTERAALSSEPELKVTVAATLQELNQELTAHESRLNRLKASLTEIEAEASRRSLRRKEIREQQTSIPERLETIQQQLELPPPADESPLLTAARRTYYQALRQSLEQQIPALRSELILYDAEQAVQLLQQRRELLESQIALAEQEVLQLRDLVNRRLRIEAEERLRQASREKSRAHPLLREVADRNRELAETTQRVVKQIESSERASAQARELHAEVQRQFSRIQEKVQVESVGLTEAIGLLLRKQRANLPDASKYRRLNRERQQEIGELEFSRLYLEDERDELNDIGATVEQILGDANRSLTPEQRSELEQAARELIERRKEYLNTLLRHYNIYFDNLFELATVEQQLIGTIEEFANYIDERVLWIRSNRPFGWTELTDASRSLTTLFHPTRWRLLGELLWEDGRQNPIPLATAIFLFGSLIYFRRRFRHELRAIGEQAERSSFSRFDPTLRAALLTLIISSIWPLLLWYVAWRLNEVQPSTDFAQAVSSGLLTVAGLFFLFEILRQSCRPKGLAQSHFDWSASSVRMLHSDLRWLMLIGLPVAFVSATAHATESGPGKDALERLTFIAALLILAIFLERLLRPTRGPLQEMYTYNQGTWIDRLKYLWATLGIGIPLAFAVLAFAGYYYTAVHMAWRLKSTAWVLILLLYVRSFLLRWVVVYRRKLSIEQARQRRAAAAAAAAEEEGQPESEQSATVAMPPTAEPAIDLATISKQTRRLIQTGLVAVGLVWMWVIWSDLVPALGALDRWPLWYTTVSAAEAPADMAVDAERRITERIEPVTVIDLIVAVLIGAFTFIAFHNLPGLLEMSVLRRLPLDPSVSYAITSLASYVIVILGLVLTFGAIGIGWSQVQWLAAALTFGLGFGLQEIFANFVAGLIILFERPVRVGDIITIDDVTGVVSKIRIRATTIINWDRKEFIVPNKEFITGRLLNWTLTDAINRVVIDVGIAYGSDTELARDLLLKIANEHPIVVEEPAPVATFEAFGDNSLNFSLRIFLPNMQNRLAVVHEIHTAIDQEFRQAGIEIAFPQRDLHLRTVPENWNISGAKGIVPVSSPTNGEQDDG